MTKMHLGNNISYDPEEKGYIMFDLTSFIPKQSSLVINGTELFPKNEYHASLVAMERYIENKEEAIKIAVLIKEYLETHELRFIELGKARYVCNRDTRMTLVAPVTIEGIEEFKAFVGTLIPHYDPPFSHITLLKSKATEFGIGINSMNDLDQYCTLLEN